MAWPVQSAPIKLLPVTVHPGLSNVLAVSGVDVDGWWCVECARLMIPVTTPLRLWRCGIVPAQHGPIEQ